MCQHRIIVLVVFMMCTASGYTQRCKQSLQAQKRFETDVFEMFQRSTRDTATMMEDMKMVTYKQEVEADNMKALMQDQNAKMETDNERRMDTLDKEIADIRSKVLEQNTKIENINMKIENMKTTMQEDIKERMDRVDSKIENVNLNMNLKMKNMKTLMENDNKQRMDRLDAEIEQINSKIEGLTVLLEKVSVKMDLNLQCVLYQDCMLSDKSGVATIFLPHSSPNPLTPLTVYCDQTAAGGGWLVFLRRIDNTEDFPNRVWQNYRDGFGDLTGSFWLGLQSLHEITKRPATLRISLEDWDGNKRYAMYTEFSISGEADGYRLSIGAYSGDAGNSLAYSNGSKFSTINWEQDSSSTWHCSQDFGGAWWYNNCMNSQLTGHYYASGEHKREYKAGLYWYHWRGRYYSYKRAEMMLRH